MSNRIIAVARWIEEAFLQINPAFHVMRATLKKADADAAAIQRVRELHQPFTWDDGTAHCAYCNDYEQPTYPCDTIQALDNQ